MIADRLPNHLYCEIRSLLHNWEIHRSVDQLRKWRQHYLENSLKREVLSLCHCSVGVQRLRPDQSTPPLTRQDIFAMVRDFQHLRQFFDSQTLRSLSVCYIVKIIKIGE